MTQNEHQELAHLRAEVERLQADKSKGISDLAECIGERDRLKSTLERIYNYPVHSEPVGGAYAMQDIAYGALKGETK